MTALVCAWCGRAVALRGRAAEGRICSNCMSRRRSGNCSRYGKYGRIAGRAPDGQPWCERCRTTAQMLAADAECRRQVVAAVATLEPGLDGALVEQALDATGGRRSLHQLARYFHAHPQVLIDGPTSTVPVLNRFTAALARLGARTIGPLHPACVGCGRRVRPHARRGAGWVCAACWARTSVSRCSRCGAARRAQRRDASRRPICPACARREDGEHTASVLTERIVAAVLQSEPGLTRSQTLHVVQSLAGGRDRCSKLALMAAALPLQEPARLTPIAGRLVIALRVAGAANIPWPLCHRCGAAVDERAAVGADITCSRCAERSCPVCGRRPCAPGRRCCARCAGDRKAAQHTGRAPRGTCTDCQRPDRRLDRAGRCRWCRERAARRCERCDGPPPHTLATGHRLCLRCTVAWRLDAILGGSEAPPALQPLQAAVLAAADPRATLNWLRRSRAASVLADLAAGRMALTHEGLDALGADDAIDHLRALLVAAGALPADSRPVSGLEAAAQQLLASVDHPDRQRLAAWVRWSLVPGVRQRGVAGGDVATSAANGRRALREVVRFVDGLHRQGRVLAGCTQTDIDEWFARPGAARRDVRSFLVWCRRHEHVPPLVLPPSRRGGLTPPADPEERWTVARRLVTDSSLPDADRVAGALLVLYGQPMARIARLTTADVHRDGDRVSIAVGRGALLQLHEPFATLVDHLPVRRTQGVGDQFASPWLFPGSRAGEHLRPVNLAARLRRLGIHPRSMRNGARAQLAAEIPPAMLADILGIDAQTAVAWAAASGGNWSAYASRRRSGSGHSDEPD